MKIKSIFLFATLLMTTVSFSQSVNTYVFTGAPENFTVPVGVTEIFVTAVGASGGCDTLGGLGAEVCDTIQVSAGMMFQVNVGGASTDTIGGWNGGGAGGNTIDSLNTACGGGGASDLRIAPYALGDRVLVAGGGGGKGGGPGAVGEGGDAGCPDGENGGNGFQTGGSGATATMWGAGGAPWGPGGTGLDGSLGNGGNGASDPCFDIAPGGGGGGGFYGGGGGSSDCFNGSTAAGGGGGGGSSYYSANGCCTPGINSGDGQVIISFGVLGIDEIIRPTIIVDQESQIIFIEGIGQFSYEIYNLNGQLIQKGAGNDQTKTNIQGFSEGVYILKLVTLKSIWTEKIKF